MKEGQRVQGNEIDTSIHIQRGKKDPANSSESLCHIDHSNLDGLGKCVPVSKEPGKCLGSKSVLKYRSHWEVERTYSLKQTNKDSGILVIRTVQNG